jgi:hypothetical protein
VPWVHTQTQTHAHKCTTHSHTHTLTHTGFDSYLAFLQQFLAKYRFANDRKGSATYVKPSKKRKQEEELAGHEKRPKQEEQEEVVLPLWHICNTTVTPL